MRIFQFPFAKKPIVHHKNIRNRKQRVELLQENKWHHEKKQSNVDQSIIQWIFQNLQRQFIHS